ncbi:Flp pilus assembly protein TadD, contains TPR repeats [Pseudomonas pohangensis]|uniref:Flp pilus assembly protein TadD, contains TPR repeats n=1 Tax=Pseudomonas pohangensis TaxID=364197 RepID=A0A1H2GIS2_9PSED|nr:tetratricopeptide repeat protein [Pseudomonas pohangensis]SDU19339.1 Flp pilus assembly protein TadD, contains TPR repeats [Pseudomonas pohangensis]
MNRFFALYASLALVGGCQSALHSWSDTAATPAPADQSTIKQTPPAAPFSQQTLYDLLTAEIAGQRNHYDIALENYSAQAKATGDPGVAKRAYQIAEYLNEQPASLNNALLWAKVAPDDIDAQRAAAIQLARSGRYDESMRYMERVLQGQGDTHFDFLALSASESDPQTRAGLLQSFDRLLLKHPGNGQLLFGKALLLQQDNQPEAALQVLEDEPASQQDIMPLLLQAQLLQSMGRSKEALPLLEDGLELHPQDKRLRLAYARLLIEQGRMEDARAEFTLLLQQNPEDDDLRLSLALIYMDDQAWSEAQAYLRDLIERDAHVDIAHFNLGLIDEQLNDHDGALIEYSLVGPGDQYLAAQAQQTALLLNLQRPADARQRLAEARTDQPGYAVQLYMLEVESLAAKQYNDLAWQAAQQSLQQFPGNLSLLYTRAMLAEQRNDLAQMERDLRQIIKAEPTNAMALNALGYTLADRTTRYAEAQALIERAHKLQPDDPAILDSLGWVYYRTGNLDQAETYLRQALQNYPDAEIAAHLGEVLWIQGKQEEAREIWAQSLQRQPDSSILRSTMQRLTGSETP